MSTNVQNCPFANFFSVIFLGMFTLATQSLIAEDISLERYSIADSRVRVKTVVDVAGSLQVETQEKKTLELAMEANAELFFDEQGLDGNHSPAVRHYWEAKADFTINDEKESRQLRDDRSLIVLGDNDQIANRFWSPNGMLTRQELDLLDVAGNAFPPELLLPEATVDSEEPWKADDIVTAQLLRLTHVTSGELTNTIKEITADTVKIELTGEVEGTADGAATKIEVTGNYHFDRSKKFISWFAIAIKEKREIGFATPGFDVTARIRSARQRIQTSEALSKQVVQQARRKSTAGEMLLDFESEDDLYRAALDRRWHIVKRHKSSAIMRLVDGDDLLATCKVDRLNRMPAGKQITLHGFQSDVQAALDKNCKEVLSASESLNPQGVRVLRVAARGDVGETPIRWIYYHLSDDEGQRLSLIFTHESSLESRIAGMDESMTSSIMLLPRKQQQEQQAKKDTRILK